MHHTRVKICGITQAQDALQAAQLGADAIGLVFYEKSPRCIHPDQAQMISRQLPAFVDAVALFKDADLNDIERVLSQVQVELLQFHGSESAEFCRQFGKPYIKALGMGMAGRHDILKHAIHQQAERYHDARALLLDSHAPGEAGGSGEPFDWNSIPDKLPQPVILAGGLNAGNVAQAIKTVQPYAVDVSSGVEKNPGIKDAALIAAFMQEVKHVNCEQD